MQGHLIGSRSHPSLPTISKQPMRLGPSSGSSKSANSRASLESRYLRAEGPYITYEMIRKMREKVRNSQEEKKKWITPHGFATSVRPLKRFIPNYVQASPSENPKLHSYRDANREKWLGGPFIPAPYHSKPLEL